jgi:hypothetical protein
MVNPRYVSGGLPSGLGGDGAAEIREAHECLARVTALGLLVHDQSGETFTEKVGVLFHETAVN